MKGKMYRPQTDRWDKNGPNAAHRKEYEKNRKILMSTQNTCSICGRVVDFSLKPPDPLSACVDHIVPIIRGGHPSDINNLQLAHWTCNRQKADKIHLKPLAKPSVVGNRNLPQSRDWSKYKS